jgi:AraC family transcriptional regulator
MILRSEAGSTEKAGVAYAQSLASALAMHIVRRYSRRCDVGVNPGKGLAPRALRRALQFIHDHLDEDLTIQQLAETTEMSACHFARMFRLSTGIPPHKYVVRRRVTRAKHLLLNKGVSLATAALEAGFCDQGHMTRCFRQVLGTTPAVFVRSIRGVSERDKG